MRWVTLQDRQLLVHTKTEEPRRPSSEFSHWITPGTVHELLFDSPSDHAASLFPALFVAGMATKAAGSAGVLAWLDPSCTVYPPAIARMGIPPDRILLLRPQSADLIWTAIECLRCPAIRVLVAPVDRPLNQVQVRQFQLAAEKGNTTGILLRPRSRQARVDIYSATTRWLVTPARGERAIQRWRFELIHGHGRHIGSSFILEQHRATGQANFVHPPAPLVHHPSLSAAQ